MAKKAYIGAATQEPIIGTRVNTITASTLADYFEVEHPLSGGNGFTGDGGVFSSVAASSSTGTATSKTEWTAKGSFKGISLDYVVGSKPKLSAVDFYITVAGVEVVSSAIAGETGHWSGAINEGETIVFYSKNAAVASAVSNVSVATDYILGYETKEVARKVKKGYIGIDGIARKIKKAYIGIGGVARPCWGNGELEYYGTITPLSAARTSLAATTIGKYALFGGGEDSAGESAVVDAYNTSLVRSTPAAFSAGDKYVKATTVGSYAMFAGRYGVKAYNASLTITTKDAEDVICYTGGSAASVGNYALFAYGHATSQMTAYDSSLTKRTPTSLSYSAYYRGSASVGGYALFGGGMRSVQGNVACQSSVNAYDSSLTRSSATALSKSRYSLATTTIGNYALFAGGNITTTTSSNTSTDIVDVYDDSLTRSTMSLSVAKRNLAATTVGGFALVGGGLDAANGAVVDVFDINLTRKATTPLSGYRSLLAATSVGDYALFGGGKTDAFSAVVDVYST